MGQIVHRSSAALAQHPVAEYSPANGGLRALIEAKREGFLGCTDLTSDRIASIRRHPALAETAAQSVPLLGVKTWLGHQAQFVSNPPDPETRSVQSAVFAEVCSDIPVGSRWPAPGELYTHLVPFAEAIRAEVTNLRAILVMAENPGEPERKRLDAKEMARPGALAAEVIRELRAASGETENRA